MNQTPLQYAIARVMPQAIATGLLVSLCTIQSPGTSYSPGGAPLGTFNDVAGLINIQCMDAVLADGSIQATETKGLDDIMSAGYRHVFLNGFYPTVIANVKNGWRAVVDGVAYDLLGAEPDSQSTQTRLKLQLVSV